MSAVVTHPPGRPGIEPASTGGLADRDRPSVAHTRSKYAMGTGSVQGFAPG